MSGSCRQAGHWLRLRQRLCHAHTFGSLLGAPRHNLLSHYTIKNILATNANPSRYGPFTFPWSRDCSGRRRFCAHISLGGLFPGFSKVWVWFDKSLSRINLLSLFVPLRTCVSIFGYTPGQHNWTMDLEKKGFTHKETMGERRRKKKRKTKKQSIRRSSAPR